MHSIPLCATPPQPDVTPKLSAGCASWAEVKRSQAGSPPLHGPHLVYGEHQQALQQTWQWGEPYLTLTTKTSQQSQAQPTMLPAGGDMEGDPQVASPQLVVESSNPTSHFLHEKGVMQTHSRGFE